MTVLRIFAIISILFIISTSSAPQGIEFGIKSKVYFGRDGKGGGGGDGGELPKFEIRMPNLKMPMGMGAPSGFSPQKQQLPIQVPPQLSKNFMALMKPLIDSGMAQQALGPILG